LLEILKVNLDIFYFENFFSIYLLIYNSVVFFSFLNLARNQLSLLLSLLLLSCIIALIEELINKLYSFTSNLQNNQLELSKHYSIDIETDFSRDHSIFPNINSLRETSANFAIFSIDYVEYIQA